MASCVSSRLMQFLLPIMTCIYLWQGKTSDLVSGHYDAKNRKGKRIYTISPSWLLYPLYEEGIFT